MPSKWHQTKQLLIIKEEIAAVGVYEMVYTMYIMGL